MRPKGKRALTTYTTYLFPVLKMRAGHQSGAKLEQPDHIVRDSHDLFANDIPHGTGPWRSRFLRAAPMASASSSAKRAVVWGSGQAFIGKSMRELMEDCLRACKRGFSAVRAAMAVRSGEDRRVRNESERLKCCVGWARGVRRWMVVSLLGMYSM